VDEKIRIIRVLLALIEAPTTTFNGLSAQGVKNIDTVIDAAKKIVADAEAAPVIEEEEENNVN